MIRKRMSASELFVVQEYFPLFFLLVLTQVFKPYIDFSMYLWVKLNELLLTSHVQRSLKIRCLFRNFRFINEDAGYFPVKFD